MTGEERIATLVLYGCLFGWPSGGTDSTLRYVYHPNSTHQAVLWWSGDTWRRSDSTVKELLEPTAWSIDLIEAMPKLTFNNWMQYLTR